MTSRVRVYIATSVDGFIAGPGDDLSWLPSPEPGEPQESPGGLSFEAFIENIGALLMGRRTYDVVLGFGGEWPYGDRPVLVASHRALGDSVPTHVRRVEGQIQTLVAEAKEAAHGRDVYIDGGALIRQACDAGLVDDLTITLAPIALGAGHPLFGGLRESYGMELVDFSRFPGGMLQLRLLPKRSSRGDAT
jgi:dihydrofolate reductase